MRKENKKVRYLNIPCAFDTETTSVDPAFAFAYIYIFGYDVGNGNEIYTFRTADEFKACLERFSRKLGLNENRRVICYAHNLPYDFQFIYKQITFDEVFAVEPRKPIKALARGLGIEFRDSYILTRLSLANLAKRDGLPDKLVGDLDYTLIRHAETELTERELGYCRRDVEILLEHTKIEIDEYGAAGNIPLTNTGRVREVVRDAAAHNDDYKRFIKDNSAMSDLEFFRYVRPAFLGGYTHGNINYAGRVLKNVTSIDLASSYPAVMLSEKMPMSRAQIVRRASSPEFTSEYMKVLNDDRLLSIVEFEAVSITRSTAAPDCFMSKTRREKLDPLFDFQTVSGAEYGTDNGRIFSADYLKTTLTCIDFQIFLKAYKVKELRVLSYVTYRAGYLPAAFLDCVLEFYETKTKLKGVAGREAEYQRNKELLNSCYGMCVTDPIRPDNIFAPLAPRPQTLDPWRLAKLLDGPEMRRKLHMYNFNPQRFLFYPWGVFITAYARKNLWDGILAIGDDYVYSDTDSIKFLGDHSDYIADYNRRICEKVRTCLLASGLDPERAAPVTIDGQKKPIGVWEIEDRFKLFKHIGAKKYIVYSEKEDRLISTVAGLKKEFCEAFLMRNVKDVHDLQEVERKAFKEFREDLVIPKEFYYLDKFGNKQYCRSTAYYFDIPQEREITDYQGHTMRVYAGSGISLISCDFTMHMCEYMVTADLMRGLFRW